MAHDRTAFANNLALLAGERPHEVVALGERLAAGLALRHLAVPQEGLALLTMEDGVCGDRFHLGEAALATAHVEVRAGGTLAQGGAAILGARREVAVAAAVCDAVAAAGLPGAEEALALAAAGAALGAERARRRDAMRSATRVDFAELGESA